MILIIGGLASGKREFVKREFGYKDADISDGKLDESPVLYNLQNLIFGTAMPDVALMKALLEKNIVICNEVGSGVVPIDKKERAAREATGRLCVELADKAEKVIRVCCGIPTVIKG